MSAAAAAAAGTHRAVTGVHLHFVLVEHQLPKKPSPPPRSRPMAAMFVVERMESETGLYHPGGLAEPDTLVRSLQDAQQTINRLTLRIPDLDAFHAAVPDAHVRVKTALQNCVKSAENARLQRWLDAAEADDTRLNKQLLLNHRGGVG